MLRIARPCHELSFCLTKRPLGSAFGRRLHTGAENTVLHIPRSNVHRLGQTNSAPSLFNDLEWTIKDGESWAVVGSGSGEKSALLETLQGLHRISPYPSTGLFPFLTAQNKDPHTSLSLVSFAHRLRPTSSSGGFYDYTARYGAVFEEDRITLRQEFFPETLPEFAKRDNMRFKEGKRGYDMALFEELVDRLDLGSFLDLPVIALSNGQTRKARILKALLEEPEILLLDEPLTGLDVNTRPLLLTLLRSLHVARRPRMIIGLRKQDPIPEWISHVALVGGSRVQTGRVNDMVDVLTSRQNNTANSQRTDTDSVATKEGKVLLELNNVNVRYYERHVLKDINWTIREGDRWHLQGPNGSGKTTLLSMITGDHPQSYTQRGPRSSLNLFGKPRSKHATAQLAARIGIVTPELYNAFPRRRGMSVWDVVGTGFNGNFVPRGPDGVGIGMDEGLTDQEREWRVCRMKEVLSRLGPATWTITPGEEHRESIKEQEAFAEKMFVDLSGGEQSIVLLMRALVGRPPLVILDEVWSGMDDGMIESARRYLRGDGVGDDQAVIVVSHWEEEVPWGEGDGAQSARKFKIQDGLGTVA